MLKEKKLFSFFLNYFLLFFLFICMININVLLKKPLKKAFPTNMYIFCELLKWYLIFSKCTTADRREKTFIEISKMQSDLNLIAPRVRCWMWLPPRSSALCALSLLSSFHLVSSLLLVVFPPPSPLSLPFSIPFVGLQRHSGASEVWKPCWVLNAS